MTLASDRDAWLAVRHEHITASDMAAVLGLNPYTSRNAVLKLKTGPLSAYPDLENNPAVRAGRFKEEGVFNWFIDDHKAAGHLVGKLVMSAATPCIAATCDGRVFLTDGPGETVEIKVGGEKQRAKWTTLAKSPKAWGSRPLPEPLDVHHVGLPRDADRDTIGAPLHYWVQLQTQLYVTEDTSGWVVGDIGGTSRYDVHYKRDEAFVRRMVNEAEAFWAEVLLVRNRTAGA